MTTMVENYREQVRKLGTELHFKNLALAKRNAECRELKSELRLLRRIWALVNRGSTLDNYEILCGRGTSKGRLSR